MTDTANPTWLEDTEARDEIMAWFGIHPKDCQLVEVTLPAWKIEYELVYQSGLYNELNLHLVDLGYEEGYWVMGYAEDINTLFYRRYKGS